MADLCTILTLQQLDWASQFSVAGGNAHRASSGSDLSFTMFLGWLPESAVAKWKEDKGIKWFFKKNAIENKAK